MKRLLLAAAIVVAYHLAVSPPAVVVAPIPAVHAVAGTLSAGDRATLARGYRAMADLVERDETLTTTSLLREFHSRGLAYVWGGLLRHPPGTCPELGAAIDDAMAEALTLDDREIDAEYRQRAATFLRKVADSL